MPEMFGTAYKDRFCSDRLAADDEPPATAAGAVVVRGLRSISALLPLPPLTLDLSRSEPRPEDDDSLPSSISSSGV